MESNLRKELDIFRNLISKEKELTGCSTDDDFLMKFLRAKDMEPAPALVTLKKYIKMRKKMRFYNPDSVREVLDCGSIQVLKKRDAQGRQVLICSVDLWDPKTVTAEQQFVATLLCFEQLICSVKTQQNGAVILADLNGFTFSHVTKLRYGVLTDFIRVFQGSFPLRVKEIHILNQPKVFGILYTFACPLISDKLMKRLHIHGKDLQSLHNFLPPNILPESLGGVLSEDLAFDQCFIPKLLSRDEWFKNTTNLISTNNN